MKVVLLALCLSLAASALAQSSRKTKIAFDCSCDDEAGSVWATAFRDQIATSPRFEQTADAEYSVAKDEDGKDLNALHWHVDAVTVAAGRNSAAISFVILLGNTYFVSQISQSCPEQQAKSCAAADLASLDSAIQRYNANQHH